MNDSRDELRKTLNEKDIYKLLNDVNNDDIEFEDIEIDDLRIKKLKKNLRRELESKNMSKKMRYILSIASGLIICIGTIGIMGVKDPAFAKDIPVLSTIIQMLNDNPGYSGDYEKYTQTIGQTQYDSGIGVTLNEVVFEKSEVIMSYTVKSDKKTENLGEVFIPNYEIKINGKIEGYGGSSKTEKIDDYTFSVLSIYDIGQYKLPDKFDMDFNIYSMFDIKGEWKFAFNLSKEELMKESKVFNVDIEKDFEGTDIIINSIDFTPLSTSIQVSGKMKKNLNDLNSRIGFFEYDYWLLFDDNGKEIVRRDGGSCGSRLGSFKSEYKFDAIDEIPGFVTVVPLQYRIQEEGSIDENGKTRVRKNKKEYIREDVKKLVSDTVPLEIEQGRFGKLIINEIREKDDKTIIKYQTTGKLPFFQGKELFIENEAGEKLNHKITAINNGYDNEKFTIEVGKLNPDEKYYFVTSNLNNIDFKEEYIFKIPIE